MNPKSVYRKMNGDNKSAKKIPLKEELNLIGKNYGRKKLYLMIKHHGLTP